MLCGRCQLVCVAGALHEVGKPCERQIHPSFTLRLLMSSECILYVYLCSFTVPTRSFRSEYTGSQFRSFAVTLETHTGTYLLHGSKV